GARALAIAAILRPAQAMARLAVIGIDDMAGGAARRAVIAWLIIGAHEPSEGIVEPRLVDVEQRHGDAQARARPAVRLADIRAARLLKALEQAGGVGQADFRKLGADIAPA